MEFKTEKEIFNQYDALKETYKYFQKNNDKIKKYLNNINYDSITFIGSGSSYSLCKSAALSVKLQLNVDAHSIPAGDLMLNFSHYENIVKNTLLVTPSRSGSTSEVVLAVQKAKKEYGVPSISISANEDSDLSKVVGLSLEIPWAFDESVCQTRTVTNLYTANLLLIDLISDTSVFIQDIKKALDYGETFISDIKIHIQEIGEDSQWDKVVVLADSELEGIADEGSLAFKEISRISSSYHHLLDVRHGPMVLIDEKTLVIMAISENGLDYQSELVADLKAKGAKVVTVGLENESNTGSDLHIEIPDVKYAVRGIPFIFVPQAIAYFKAIKNDINPDEPEGLDPWISL